MVVVMQRTASQEDLEAVVNRLRELGFATHISRGVERTIIGAVGEKTIDQLQRLEAMSGVERIVPILQPFKLAGREFQPETSQIQVGNVVFGGQMIPVIAGPCAVENEKQLFETADHVKKPEHPCCEEELSNPVRRPTRFRVWKKRACVCWPRLGGAPATGGH